MGFPASALKQKIPGTSCKGLVEVGGGLSSMIRFGGTFQQNPFGAMRLQVFFVFNPQHCKQASDENKKLS